jgi:hypothetical protein
MQHVAVSRQSVLWLQLSAGELKHVLTLLPIYQVRMKSFLCEGTTGLLSTQFLGGRSGICLIRFLFLPPFFAQSYHKIYSYNITHGLFPEGFVSKRAMTPKKRACERGLFYDSDNAKIV